MEEIKNKIVYILKKCELYEGDVESFKEEKIKEILSNMNSFDYINFIVEVENTFFIVLPDELLFPESITTYEKFVEIIEELRKIPRGVKKNSLE